MVLAGVGTSRLTSAPALANGTWLVAGSVTGVIQTASTRRESPTWGYQVQKESTTSYVEIRSTRTFNAPVLLIRPGSATMNAEVR